MQFGVSESIYHWGKYRPQSVAVYSDNHVITYSELNKMINVLSLRMKNNIHEKRVGLAIKNKLNFLVALVSVLRLNKSNVFLNTGLSKENLKINIKDSGLTNLIYDSANSDFLELMPVGSENINIENVDLLVESALVPEHSSEGEDEWGVLFSSGTTGTPKGIERDHYSIITEHLGWCLELGLNRNTKFYLGRPLYYTGGLVLLLSTLLVGGSIVINNFKDDNDFQQIWFDYQKTLNNVENISWAFFVPDQIRKFFELAENKEINRSTNILIMGAPISGEEKSNAYRLLKSNIVESWGNSESLGTITDPEDLFLRPDSIGRPFLTDEMYIVDENNEKIVNPEIVGRIAGDEEAGFKEYTNRPEETKKIKKNEMIISEDLGYYDEIGYFYIKARVQDSIIRNGETIFLNDIEKKLRNKLNFREICIDIRGDENNYQLVLFINQVEIKGFSIEESLARCNIELSEGQKLNYLIPLKSLPKTSSGKIDKSEIKKIVVK